MPHENALNIYTDGASMSSPRAGGIGVRFVIVDSTGHDLIKDFQFPGYKGATNNQMELNACIMGMKKAEKMTLPAHVAKIVIYSDSRYIVDNVPRAKFQWPKNHWLNYWGRPILNADLWKVFLRSIQRIRLPVEVRWVRGHSKNEHNKAADRLARKSARAPLNRPLKHVNVRRKITTSTVEVGSVRMTGQRITLRVITSEYLKQQRIWKYKYEVISKGSQDRGRVDIVYSEILLSPGHAYYVTVNSDTSNPRISKLIREAKR